MIQQADLRLRIRGLQVRILPGAPQIGLKRACFNFLPNRDVKEMPPVSQYPSSCSSCLKILSALVGSRYSKKEGGLVRYKYAGPIIAGELVSERVRIRTAPLSCRTFAWSRWFRASAGPLDQIVVAAIRAYVLPPRCLFVERPGVGPRIDKGNMVSTVLQMSDQADIQLPQVAGAGHLPGALLRRRYARQHQRDQYADNGNDHQ